VIVNETLSHSNVDQCLYVVDFYNPALRFQYSLFLPAMSIPCIAKAIGAIHQAPEHNWTLERLAEISHTSRSSFSKKFTASVGMPVMHYLTLWRMHRAQSLLRSGESNLDLVASQVGYSSSTAFHKAFKRTHGYTPKNAMQMDLVAS